MRASLKRRSIPDSNPNPSQMLYVVASGKMAADISEALINPTPKSRAAKWPAKGASALAASATS